MKSNRLSTRNSDRSSGSQFRRNAVALGVAVAIASSAYANPTGMSVVAGQATAQTIGNLMQITNTPGAILNWQQFNIDVGQTTQFIQQNAASQVFNRVTGGDVSQILGTLQSNGQVFLINPAGVFFGQGAVIDTAGFLASTLAASDTDLLNGHLRFNDSTGTAGNIVNQGSLTTHSGGSIVLLAPSIENSGIIHADGEVLLAAGHSVTIVDLKHPTIGLTVAAKEGDKAVNLGQIISKNVSLFSHLVKNSGVVEATGAQVGEGGVIRFIAQGDALVGGQVLAESSTGKGGEIDITGERVAVLNGARISADGATGGGTVHVGGGWKGQDESLANSQQTVVQANTQISANATVNGNGGEVVVWADGHTTVNSEVQAKGGALGGNGGRVETSGKQSLAANVAANTSAANGEAGQWLIDPANLTIVANVNDAPSGSFNLENSSMSPFFSTDDISPTFSPTESYLLNSTVVSGLENNGFVQILTTGQQAGEGNLTIAAPILVDQNLSGSTGINPFLFLEAKGEINIDAAVGLAPGQQAFNGFFLNLSYDIAKPVYIDAPLYLGNSGSLTLSPYNVGTALPTNTQGLLPLDGVNLLSGINGANQGQPLLLNQISISSETFMGTPIKLNVLGANLMVNDLISFTDSTTPALDIRVGVDNFDLPMPVQGSLQYNKLLANSLTVDAGATVSTYSVPGFNEFQMPITIGSSTDLSQLVTNGTVNFNGGSANISNIDVNSGTLNFLTDGTNSGSSFGSFFVGNIVADTGSTINLVGSDLDYQKAMLNGTFNMMSDQFGSPSFLNAIDTDLNGTFNISGDVSAAGFQALGMGANSEMNLSAGSRVELGRTALFSSQLSTSTMVPAKQEGAYISSTQGQFVAQQGALITMNGIATDQVLVSDPPLQTAESSSFFPSGAVLDITGLDGRLDAPVNIEVNGFQNSIQTGAFNFNSSVASTPITNMVIEAANIQVNAGGDGRALRIGESLFSSPPPSTQPLEVTPSSTINFEPSVDLDFNGSLTVNSGRVRLEGKNVSTLGSTLNVNGGNSTLIMSGNFTSADLYTVNRTNGGRLAAEGLWDNSLVNADNAATSAPLSKGDIFVGDDLIITGGLLTSAGTANAINILPDSFLELRNTEVSTTINVSPTGALLLATQDIAATPEATAVAPAVLNGANINMGGDAFLIVETDSSGVANLNGTATISSGAQGNLIIAGRRTTDSLAIDAIPDTMTLNVGSGIRLNVTGNAPSLPPALQLLYGTSTAPQRPVFLVGQLTPEAVAIAEYEDFDGFSTPITTVLTGFANPSFVIDGTPDSQAVNGLTCSSFDFCVKFDVEQNVSYSGMVMSSLGGSNPTVANSGVAFAPGANLSGLQFAFQTPTDITFMQGLNIVTVADLAGGRRLVNAPGSTVRFGNNMANETISNNLENNGILELQGNYTLSGLLTGTGTLNNSGSLLLSNGTGSLIQNTILNSGTITNTGSYSLTNLSSSGAANFFNTGTLNFNPGQYVFGSGGYVQTAGNLTVQPGALLSGNININGGAFRGFATISGNLNAQGGRIVPGASPGLLTVSGDLNLDANSVLDIEILSDGGEQGTDFDCILVQGNANLAGQLNLIDISGGTLTTGSQYAFLEANTINGSFAGVSTSPQSIVYTFATPTVDTLTQPARMFTQTVATGNSPALTQTTGGTNSAVSQNLNQAFVPPPTSSTTTQPSSGTTSTSSTQQTQQEEQAVEVANQSTAGTTISQQSNDIELTTTKSDPQRASAVCK